MSFHAERRGPTLLLTVDRPETRNAVDAAVHEGMRAALDGRGDARAIVLTGAGGTFISGGDLEVIRKRPFGETLELCERMTSLLERFETLPIPVLAAIEGYAFGGGLEIALACDYRVAGPGAKLSFRQAAMGLTTGWGAATRLSRLVPRGVAVRLTMTAEIVGAEDAQRLGLVDEVAEEPLARCLELTDRIAAHPRAAIAGFKRVLREAYASGAGASRAHEWEVFRTLYGAHDHVEALEAFFARR